MRADSPWWMTHLELASIDELTHRQDGVVGRDQLVRAGVSFVEIRRHLRRREWTLVWPGVYATRPGSPPAYGMAIGALLYAGLTATWSHATAAHQLGLRTAPPPRIDVSIEAARQVRPQPGLRIHRIRHLEIRRLDAVVPPRVTPGHAVVDQVAEQYTLNSAVALVADSCQTGRVSLDEVEAASRSRRHRWGVQVRAMAGAMHGSDSLLEVLYIRDVERRHRLPTSARQRRSGQDISDCAYDAFGVLVELDGRVHLVAERWWRDMAKDNRSALRGELTLRYGWLDVRHHPCDVAAQVLGVLRQRGYRGEVRPCRAGCPVARWSSATGETSRSGDPPPVPLPIAGGRSQPLAPRSRPLAPRSRPPQCDFEVKY